MRIINFTSWSGSILQKFTLKNWRGDVAGGLSAGIIAIPLALAFGEQSGLGALAGLYGAIALGIFASLFGGTPTQISGPTGPMVVVAAMVVGNTVEQTGNLENAFPVIFSTFILAGVFQVVFGILKFGKYIRYIPYPVVSGFMSGIGIIIILMQIFPLIGSVSPKGIFNIFIHLPDAFREMQMESAILGFSTIAIIYMFPKITRTVPNILLALVVVSAISAWAGFNVAVIGHIPSKLPDLTLGAVTNLAVNDLQQLYIPAITLALLGSIDSLLTSVIADNVTKSRHDSNQELMGQGIGNIISGSIGGLPGAGTTMSTLVNTNSGATSRLSGMVHGFSLILVLTLGASLAGNIPIPVLAGILITVGIGIIDYKGLRHIKILPRTETMVMGLVLFMTVFADLIQAVAIGMIFSTFLFMKKMSDLMEHQTEVAPLDSYQNETISENKDDSVCLMNDISQFIFVKKLSGPLFFGFASAFQDIAKKLQNIPILILNVTDVPYIDQTGLYALEEVMLDLKSHGVTVFISGLQDQPRDMLTKVEIIPSLVPEEYLFTDLSECSGFLSKKKNLDFLNEDED
ncbi:MAG: SulP family inorganic anion transporter [Candidatus Nitronauta litoralis]|uniref:SulP family inorganic anion transporter n=1 Tax=Candidatus Nitronauta litoralis TaxID=2705533 RepID=A0A7T0BXP6_9BACT|nr:MAG: SulP family inorganic anion transporter [Candidatus Nitronauta litoralis]